MKYNFKVKFTPELYKIFLECDEDYNEDEFKELSRRYSEFRINYNDNPDSYNIENIIGMIENVSDDYQILLKGISDNQEDVLAWYFVGEEDEDDFYKEGINAFKKILKFKMIEYN